MVEAAGAKKRPYLELPAFIEDLRQRTAVAARALEFLILTATRTSEALNATWGEYEGSAGASCRTP